MSSASALVADVSHRTSEEKVTVMWATFHGELTELITDLARMTRLAGQILTNAAIALHQTDRALADVVIADCDQMTASLDDLEQRCVILLTRQAASAEGQRVVIAAVRAVDDVQRMAHLARHIAIIPQLKNPNPMNSSPARPVLARMRLLASQLAADAAAPIEHRDPLSGDLLAEADNEVNTLRPSPVYHPLRQGLVTWRGTGRRYRPHRPLLRTLR